MTTLAPLVVSGITTSFIPFTTPFSLPPSASCASQIYSQAGTGGALIAFDPIYWASLVPSAPECMAQELTAWWFQNGLRTGTTTVLAPFSCPDAYTTASTRAASGIGGKGDGAGWKEIFCCPSSYTFQLSVKPATIGQCISTMSPGSIFTVKTQNAGGTWVDAVSTVGSAPLPINAVHLNGLAFASPTTMSTKSAAAGSTTAAAQPAGSASTTAAMSTATSTSTDTPAAASQPLSAGASAGIGIGAALLVLLGVLAAFLLWRRHGRKKKARAVEKDAGNDAGFRFGGYGIVQQQHGPNEMAAGTGMSPQMPGDRYAGGWNQMKVVEVGDRMGRAAELPTPVHELDGGGSGRMI